MVQPKYSPEEALQKMKLMMKYDSSKTLNENRQIISEQEPTLANTALATGIGAGTGLGAAALGAGTLAGGSVGTGAMAVGAAFPGVAAGSGAALALGASVLGGAAALALVPLVMWYTDKDEAKPKVERIMQYCKTDYDKIAKINRGNSESEIRNLSDQLYDAMNGLGTDEEKVYGAFKSLKSASDFCALVTRFNRDYGSQGDLLEWLDDDFDSTSEWDQIFRPIRDIVEDTLLSIKDDSIEEKCKANPNDPSCNKKVKKEGGGGYKPCTGTYQKGCKSDVIAKVQGCLGLVTDGKFGPKTQAALSGKGFTTFTDADVTKICEKTVESEVSGESPADIDASSAEF
jgi:hypothetical protein